MFLKNVRKIVKGKVLLLLCLISFSQATILAEGFLAGTKVLGEKGYLDIDQIKIGDKVTSYNFKEKVIKQAKVTKLHTTKVTKLYKISFNDKHIFVDENHKFFCPLREKTKWIKSKDLEVNDFILNNIYNNIRINNIEVINGNFEIYNISVEGTPFFFITTDNVLVHNFIPIFIGLGAIGGFEVGISVCFFGGLFAGIFGFMADNKPAIKIGKIGVGVGGAGWGSNLVYKKWTNKEAKSKAEDNGWVPDGKDDRDNPAFKDPKSGKRYAPDNDQHGAKKWKWIDRKNRRLGSCDESGNVIGD